MTQSKDTTPKGKAAQIRLRVEQPDKDHLETAAKDAGFKNPSDYYRAVLLHKHVVAVPGTGDDLILIPAAASTEEEQAAAEALLVAVAGALSGTPLLVPPPLPPAEPVPAPADQLAAVAAAPQPVYAPPPAPLPPVVQAPPVAPPPAPVVAPIVGASPPPPAVLDDPSVAAEARVDRGPGQPTEICPACGGEYAAPISQHHTRVQCQAVMQGGVVPTGLTTTQIDAPDSRDLTPAELEPDPAPPAGSQLLPGEDFTRFATRRAQELIAAGQPTLVAAALAEAEFRQILAAQNGSAAVAPAQAPPGIPAPPQVPQVPQALAPGFPAPAPALPRTCTKCGTGNVTGPCPTCGAVN